MAKQATRKPAARPKAAAKPKRTAKKAPNLNRGSDESLGVLDGNMKSVIRSAFLNRP